MTDPTQTRTPSVKKKTGFFGTLPPGPPRRVSAGQTEQDPSCHDGCGFGLNIAWPDGGKKC